MATDSAAFETNLDLAVRRWDLPLDVAQRRQLLRHFELLLEANRNTNLTRITDPAEAAIKHYADSLAVLLWVRASGAEVRTVLDVGTGAGFPAIPLSVARPDWTVTAVEATRKKVGFVQAARRSLGLTNLACVHAHSNHWPDERRFDLVTCRALAPKERAIRTTQRFVVRGGHLVVFQAGVAKSEEPRSPDPSALGDPPSAAELFAYELPLGGKLLQRVLAIYRRGE